jgi:hypothetical protein
MVALKFAVNHSGRVSSVVLGGMGLLRQGGGMQQAWTRLHDTASRRVAALAITSEQVKAVCTPVEIVVGDGDRVRRLYVEPLLAVRRDWVVVEITNADHLTCLFRSEFSDELARGLESGQIGT